MKILHTSDWHLGRTLYSKKERQVEHSAFLQWLLETIKKHSIDLLLVAGDIFDTASPNSISQKMYYDFLVNVRNAGCENIIIVGGNHDSPSFLNAPKDILAALNVVVVGNVTENFEDEIVVVKDKSDSPIAIVCAVPFLRERDISRFAEGENYSDRSKRINENIKNHYQKIAELAEIKRKDIAKEIPILATGHLSVAGGLRNKDDGVRETYIGNIEAVESDIFPEIFDYVALGHYHISSKIKEHIRYCGSPIPMGFAEASQTKFVYVLDFDADKKVDSIEIPVFQKIESVVGDKNYLLKRLTELKNQNESVWVEVIYTGSEIFSDFASWAYELINNSKIEILKLQNHQCFNELLTIDDTSVRLDDLDELSVFDKLLDKKDISDSQKLELKEYYKEIVKQIKTV